MALIGKKPDWEMRLMAYAHQEMGKPFIWGERDCTTFVRGALSAMCGTFDCPPLTYDSELGALRFYKELGYGPYEFVLSNFNASAVFPGFEQVGDLIFIQPRGLECCHIVLGTKVLGASPDDGVSLNRLADLCQEGQRIVRINHEGA